jgi:tRNA (guanine-N7-)-methyltransferase
MIYLNFSDPWPKKRHWKRRLTTKERLLKMASLLKEDGEIRFKSDNLPLYEYTLEQAPLAGLNVVTSTDHYQLAEDDVLTEYEKQFREQGKPITRIVLKKKA